MLEVSSSGFVDVSVMSLKEVGEDLVDVRFLTKIDSKLDFVPK